MGATARLVGDSRYAGQAGRFPANPRHTKVHGVGRSAAAGWSTKQHDRSTYNGSRRPKEMMVFALWNLLKSSSMVPCRPGRYPVGAWP